MTSNHVKGKSPDRNMSDDTPLSQLENDKGMTPDRYLSDDVPMSQLENDKGTTPDMPSQAMRAKQMGGHLLDPVFT